MSHILLSGKEPKEECHKLFDVAWFVPARRISAEVHLMSRKKLWVRSFEDTDIPAWPCPKCGAGALKLAEHKEGHSGEWLPHEMSEYDAESEYLNSIGNGQYPSGPFAMLLRCSSQDCREVVVMAGRFGTGDVGPPHVGTVRDYCPHFFQPALHYFEIPENCPKNITAEVMAAFAVFWSDKAGCVNHIRSAIELLLTRMKIKDKRQNGSYRPADDRIRELEAAHPELAKHMMAVKWIGNFGSHAGKVKDRDAFDAMDQMEFILNDRFATVTKVRDAILKRKGPRRGKK
jgi:hypothetical protein